MVRVRLTPEGKGLAWSALDEEGREEALEREPDGNWWLRLRLKLLGLLVPEGGL